MVTTSPMAAQVGGSHYKRLVIEPAEFWIRNNLLAVEGSIVKYISRHGFKNGAQDLDKAAHFVSMLMWFYFDAPVDERTEHPHLRGHRAFTISPGVYCATNRMRELETQIIYSVCTFTSRDHLELAADLIEQIRARDYSVPDVIAPTQTLTVRDVLYLAKDHLENYYTLLQTLPVQYQPGLARVKSVIDRVREAWSHQ